MTHTWFPRIFVRNEYRPSKVKLLTAKLLYRVGHIYYFYDIYKTFGNYLRQLNLEEEVGPSAELAYGYSLGAAVWVTFPWFGRAFRDANKGLKMAQDLGDKTREGCAYAYFCALLYLANKPNQCLDYSSKGISLLKGLGEYWDLGVAYLFRDLINCISGRLEKGMSEADEFIAVAKATNTLQNLGWALFAKGKLCNCIGKVDDQVVADIKEGIRLLKETNDKPFMVHAISTLAFTYLRRNDFNEATKAIEEAAELFPTHYNKSNWVSELFPVGAQIYLDIIANSTNLPLDQQQRYLKRARWFVWHTRLWSILFKFFNGWTFQVWGTYNWLCGRKRRAERLWDQGLHWLRTNKNNPGEDKYRIAYLLLEEAKFLLEPDSKVSSKERQRRNRKSQSNLLEAKELFESMGCVLDLQTTTDLLARITSEVEQIDSREVLTSKRHLESLLNVTRAIGSIFNLEELLKQIMEYALRVTGAERGFLLLLNKSGTDLELKVSRGEKELEGKNFSYEAYKLSLELVKEVEGKQEAQIVNTDSSKGNKTVEELQSYQVKQALAVPLKTNDRMIGIIYLDNQLAGGTFGKDELELMKAFSVQASVSIENTRLVGNMMEQERLKQEMELGREIQMNLLPKEAPQVEGLKVSGQMIPAKEIGGDYYDYITVSQLTGDQANRQTDKLRIVIGDVSGKGVAAGLIMATAKATLKGLSEQGLTPKQTLCKANSILHEYTNGEKFMTMLYLEWDTAARKMSYSSAGHEHIIIYRKQMSDKSEGAFSINHQPSTINCSVEVIPSGGIVLGMLLDIEEYLQNREILLEKGDKIILYTDGVIDAHNEKEEMYELERLTASVKKYGHKPIEELLTSLKEEVYTFIGKAEQYDDITLVVMEAV